MKKLLSLRGRRDLTDKQYGTWGPSSAPVSGFIATAKQKHGDEAHIRE